MAKPQPQHLTRDFPIEQIDRRSLEIALALSSWRAASGCVLWTGRKDRHGYGRVSHYLKTGEYITSGAHRMAWTLKHGEIPPGHYVLHRCDVRGCINPEHLFIGTAKDNSADMHRKGRWTARDKRGAHNPNRRLTTQQVAEIRLSTEPSCALASRFGVHRSTIDRVRRSASWQDQPAPTSMLQRRRAAR